MSALHLAIEGLGLWTPQLGHVEALRALLSGAPVVAPPARPAAATLPANERRRAPESVLLATEVADQAVAMSGRAASELACVFTSSHGDQAITDYMCATLATAPTALSPTKFHNSVHNAAVGYWTIATGCHAASTAVCAHALSFGAGLLEATSLALADRRPVLLVCSDIAGSGPLREVTGCAQSFGVAVVLAPVSNASALATLTLRPSPCRDAATVTLPEPLASVRDGNPAAGALDLLVPLLRGAAHARLAASPSMELDLDMEYPG
ncbi:beta-ketoacyl synthase chain length factor [Dyella sp. KRB-257]|uniref:beta-ketoacyl synthase chain length factor n=1 Tax=Dyella sp. KRB-257 TaxID=3400915 RepID=UPI003BFB5065